MNADGSNRMAVTALSLSKSYTVGWPQLRLSWSPDGKKIAFHDSSDVSGSIDIFVVNVDGSGRKNLTADHTHLDLTPVWSPDGSKILFSRYDFSYPPYGYGGTMLHTINADGTNLTPLQNGFADGWNEDFPDWSPAANKIVYSVNRWDFVQDLYIANPDGRGRQFFFGCDWTDNSCRLDANTPTFSPDGTKVAFSYGDFAHPGVSIYVKDLATGATWLVASGTSPSWQPLPPGACASSNFIDCAEFFIRQQYLDFLGRMPEASCPPNQCGLDFYLPILNGCGDNVECIRYTRGALSANFFRSPEFQAKGSYVMYLYLVAIGQRPLTVAELQDASKVERPHYTEFMADMAAISSPDDRNGPDPAKKAALTQDFVQRAEFTAKYPTSTYPTLASFGNALAATAGVTLSSATQNAVAAATTRAQVLQIIAESEEVNTKFYQPTFVTMEYFGYLRRDPENCHDPANWWGLPDARDCGYIYQNRRFNELLPQLGLDLTQNFIVRGFIESPEYRHRFGPA